MNTSALRDRLRILAKSLKQTQQLIKRLSKLSSSPSGSSPTTEQPEDGDVRAELSDEIHQSLKEQEDEFELIQQEAEDLTNTSAWAKRRDVARESTREREKGELASSVTRLGEDLKVTRIQFRKAQLQANRNIEFARRNEREQLLTQFQEEVEVDEKNKNAGDNDDLVPLPATTPLTTGGPRRGRGGGGQDKASADDLLLGASGDVTSALQRTHALMTAELERSQFARETLENSTKELSQLTDRYANLDSLLSSSRSLVSTLITSRKSDTWYLETTFYILLATIGWLVFRRLLYGPGWWLIYLPLRAIWWVLSTVLIAPLLAVFGASGSSSSGIAANSSSLLRSADNSASLSLGVNRRGIPTFPADMPAPSVRVGSGGGKDTNAQQQPVRAEEDSMAERVGRMAEKSRTEAQNQGDPSSSSSGEQKGSGSQEGVSDGRERGQEGETVLRERTAEDGPPNPKKRMWEEPVGGGDKKSARDEL